MKTGSRVEYISLNVYNGREFDSSLGLYSKFSLRETLRMGESSA